MEQQRNLVIAIALSIAILFGSQYLFPPAHPPKPAEPTAQTVPGAAPSSTGAPADSTGQAAAPATSPGAPPVIGAAATESRETALAKSPRIRIDTERLHGSIALNGARIDDLTLAQYHETADPKSPEIVLFSPQGATSAYFAEFGWVPADAGVKVPDTETAWTASSDVLTSKTPVTLSWDNGGGLSFKRTISVDDDYMFTVRQTVENHSDHEVKLLPYGRIARFGPVPVSSYSILHEGPIGVLEGKLHDGSWSPAGSDPYNYATLKTIYTQNPTSNPGVALKTTGGWLGFTDKYWLTTLIPDQRAETSTTMRYGEVNHGELYQADYSAPQVTIAPGASVEAASRLFAGPKVVKLLDKYQDEFGVERFTYAVDWGWFWFLTKPIFYALDYIYSVVGNFGIAILLLTVAVKGLFFPLANKSYKAMSKMKKLQPEVAKLREKFGDDKQRLNEEMMALYKRVGANPLAGCLPIAVQIPVFFSLYKVLFVTIEMRHAPFYGWIHDLSSPDPTTFANLFGLIPFDPTHLPAVGAFLAIGAWPLIMGCTMFLQQKLNPQPADPVQAKMMMFLPVVFTYMLAGFPAGLVIYWAWNNTLSVLQQWVIMRQAGAA